MHWLILAILFEVSGTTFMKLSEGFTKTVPSIAMFIFYLLSLVCLNFALKFVDLGIAYAIWAGVGTALIAIAGIIWFKEPMSTLKIVSIFLVIAGVVGLNLTTKH